MLATALMRRGSQLAGLVLLCLAFLPLTGQAASDTWGSLVVETTPPGAEVRFLRIKYRYKPGIILQQGRYIIEVSKPGYDTLLKEVDVVAGRRNLVFVDLSDPDNEGAQQAPEAAAQGRQDVDPEGDLRIPLGQAIEQQAAGSQSVTREAGQEQQPSAAQDAYRGELTPESQAPAETAGQATDHGLQGMEAEDLPADQSQQEQADKGLPEIDEENPPSPEELMQVSNHLAQAGELPTAIDGFSLVLKQQPKNVNAWTGRGFAYYKLGNYAQAVDDLTKALQLDEKHLSAWFHRGNAFLMAGEFDKALEDYEQALTLSTTVPDIYNARGSALYNLGQFDAAIQDFDRAVMLDPSYADAYFNRGSSYLKQGKAQLALDDFNTVLEIAPGDALAKEKQKAARRALRE